MAEWKVMPEATWEKEWREKLGDQEFEHRLAIADAKAEELMGESPDDERPQDAVPPEGYVEGYEAGYEDDDERVSDGAWAEATILRPQFRSIIMQLNERNVAKVAAMSGQKFARIVYKLAGV